LSRRLIPFVGDVILATFKANSRNAALLEEYLRIRGEEYLKVKYGSFVVLSVLTGLYTMMAEH